LRCAQLTSSIIPKTEQKASKFENSASAQSGFARQLRKTGDMLQAAPKASAARFLAGKRSRVTDFFASLRKTVTI